MNWSPEALVTLAGSLLASLMGAWATIRAAKIGAGEASRLPWKAWLASLRRTVTHPIGVALAVTVVLVGSYASSRGLVGVRIRASQSNVGVYAELMKSFRGIFQDADHRFKIKFEDEVTQGSTQTLEQIQGGGADIGLIQMNSRPGDKICAIAPIYDEYYFFIKSSDGICEDPANLKKWHEDGVERKFTIATLGERSQTYADLKLVLDALGFVEGDDFDISPTEQGYKTAIGKVRDDEDVQYGFFITGLTNDELIEKIKAKECRLIPIHANKALSLKMPGTVVGEVPQGYFGPDQTSPYPTIKTKAVLACARDMSEELAYELTKALFEGAPLMARIFGNQLGVEEMPVEQRLVFPVHPGALRYYNEDEPNVLMEYQFWISTLMGLGSVALGFWALYRPRDAREHLPVRIICPAVSGGQGGLNDLPGATPARPEGGSLEGSGRRGES